MEAELAAMLPGTMQPNLFSWNRRLGRHVKAGEYEKVMEGFRELQSQDMLPALHYRDSNMADRSINRSYMVAVSQMCM